MSSILGYLGTHVLKREVIFIDIALAQIAAVGSIAAHLIFEAHDDSPIAHICSFGCVLLAAAFYAFIRSRIFHISLEAVIGISFVIAAAAALFLVGIVPGSHIHIQHILSGSLLWIGSQQIITSLVVFSVAGICFYLFRKPIAEISNGYQKDITKDLRVVFWDFIFYVLLGVVITLSVQIGGVVIVFAYLIIPATISAMFTARLGLQLAIVWTTAITASLFGLLFAYYLDFSIGPAIAMFLGCELIIISPVNLFGRKRLLLKSQSI
jgi:zinc/manganese transport system permease protein